MAFNVETCNYFIWKIACFSPLAQKRLEVEDYRHHILVDEDTPDEIMFDIFQSLLHDLETIGVSYAAPINEVYEDDRTMSLFLNLMDYIFPATLYIYLRDDKTLQHGINDLIGGSISDGDLLHSWLDYLSRYNPSIEEAIGYYKDKLVGSSLFTDYLKGLMSHIHDQCIQTLIPHERITLIDNFLSTVKTLTEKVINSNNFTVDSTSLWDDYHVLESLLSNPDYAQRVGTWLEMRYNTLPESYRPFYVRLSKSILVSIPYDYHYYSSRQLEDPRDIKTRLLQAAILGIATKKYGASRYIKEAPEQKSYIEFIYKELTDGQ